MRSSFSLIVVMVLGLSLPGAVGVPADYATSKVPAAKADDPTKPPGDVDDAIRQRLACAFALSNR